MDSSKAISTRVGTCSAKVGLVYEAHVPKTGNPWFHQGITDAGIDEEIYRLDEAFVKILGVKPKFIRCAPNMHPLMDNLLTSLL